MAGIAVSSPVFSFEKFGAMAREISGKFDRWEMIVEGTLRLPEIEKELEEFMGSHELRFSVHSPISDINLASVNPSALEMAMREMKAAIGITGRLGIGPFTIHMGYVGPLTVLDKDRARKIARKSMLEIDRFAIDNNVVIAVENMPATRWAILTEPGEIMDLIEGTEAGICFDLGHANISGCIDGFMELSGHFRNVHLHDNHGKYDEHLVLGGGNAPVEKIVKSLSDSYSGNWVIESNNLPEGVVSKQILEPWL
jgi:sugar phosphate isomerase/epimerase